MNFDKDKATKLWEARPQNIQYIPQEGDVWLFFDTDQERTVVRWLIEKIMDDGNAQLKKVSGKDEGFLSVYPIAGMDDRDWRPEGEPKGGVVYLWACPVCNENHPIPEDDYMCQECRNVA